MDRISQAIRLRDIRLEKICDDFLVEGYVGN